MFVFFQFVQDRQTNLSCFIASVYSYIFQIHSCIFHVYSFRVSTLKNFSSRLTRVEINLTDDNSRKHPPQSHGSRSRTLRIPNDRGSRSPAPSNRRCYGRFIANRSDFRQFAGVANTRESPSLLSRGAQIPPSPSPRAGTMQPLIPHYTTGWPTRAQLSQFAEPMPGRAIYLSPPAVRPPSLLFFSPISLLRRREVP